MIKKIHNIILTTKPFLIVPIALRDELLSSSDAFVNWVGGLLEHVITQLKYID